MGIGKSKPKKPAYDGPVLKRIDHFYSIKNCADEISKQALVLADSFNVSEADGRKDHNVALGLAVRLSIHGEKLTPISEEFGKFLASTSETYDEISREQAIFQKEIHDKVIDPLQKWLQVEFKRMDAAIKKMYSLTNQYEQAKASLAKRVNGQNQLLHELTRRELQLQMDVVILELAKLRLIKDMHTGCLQEMIKSLCTYHQGVQKILDTKRQRDQLLPTH